ncbi:HAMP domain-containing histidine kinase [Clostridium swellfunianum]|uniref:sensor histidine kinase n=1 Tax=Clostridium swellfunianum TaxID=1367462 RepID=UPI00202FC2A0|nr:HAMP domain-containing sensor histidine kinase [Clostridium swellfunianum]MCM0647490.1 HAMP domain-containing histidine kinase [Clostridium swellfunianum]
MKEILGKKAGSKSIKARLVRNFMIVIFISVIAFEALLIYFTRYYFYSNVEGILTNQIKISADFYSKYFSNVSLEDNVLDNVDVFWSQTSAEVQIIAPSGKVLMDSIGFIPDGKLETSDVLTALSGTKGVWLGKSEYDGKVMAISYPLKSGNELVGALRFITSLGEIDKTINKIYIIFISIGITAILAAGLVSVILARGIVLPLKAVTKAAEKMAKGNLKTRIDTGREDEIGILAGTLNYMAEEILKKEQFKNEFISSISHELRTPLTSIKGWVITLNTDELQDRNILKDGLKIIENESERLTAMVEELLDFSRLASGKIKLSTGVEDASKIVRYIEKYMAPRAEREGLQFIVECSQEPLLAKLDKDRIKQVLINLLDNAFKFTPAGGRVMLRAFSKEGWIILCVTDNGTGIDEVDLPRVREKFYKGKNIKSHTGIGLSICDEIVKLHDGELKIESKLNEGTCISVKLPIEEAIEGVE